MKSNAPGQLLGFAIQFPRALCHLLKGGPGDTICVEVLGDVANKTATGEVLAEEDKSSVNSNPVTNKSTDLWKTFSNWIQAVLDGDLEIEKTKFLLYTNQSGRHALVNEFSSALDKETAQIAIDNAKSILNGVGHDHGIWDYYDFVVNKNETLLLEVINRFELQIGNGAGYDEIEYEIKRKHVPESQIKFLSEALGGWVLKNICEMIAAKKLAMIRWEEFNHKFMVLFDRVRRLELIDFTLQNPPEKSEIQRQVKTRPCYLKQLEIVNANDDEILEAVSDYLRAKINRQKWIEDETIDEDVASDFETKLKRFWENQRKRIELTQRNLSKTEKGLLLLADCKTRQETIRDIRPPYPTIVGTYHALADEPCLGWHPNWRNILKGKEADLGTTS